MWDTLYKKWGFLSDSSSVHHQEPFILHTAMVYVILKFHKRVKLLVYIQGVQLAIEAGISLIRYCNDNRHTLQTHTTDTLQTHTNDRHYRHTLQTHTTETHYRPTLQTHTTDTHYRHTLQTHSSSFLTQRTCCCSNSVAISSLVLELLKKCRVR